MRREVPLLTNTQIVARVYIDVEREFRSRGFTCVDDKRGDLVGKSKHAHFDRAMAMHRRIVLSGGVVMVSGRYQARAL